MTLNPRGIRELRYHQQGRSPWPRSLGVSPSSDLRSHTTIIPVPAPPLALKSVLGSSSAAGRSLQAKIPLAEACNNAAHLHRSAPDPHQSCRKVRSKDEYGGSRYLCILVVARLPAKGTTSCCVNLPQPKGVVLRVPIGLVSGELPIAPQCAF